MAILLAVGSGCARGPRFVTDQDPAAKIPAIKASVQTHDMSAVRQMVKDLDSDDSAVRFYAIGGLQRLTGQTFGYQYYFDESQRAEPVKQWNAWLKGWEAAQGHEGQTGK